MEEKRVAYLVMDDMGDYTTDFHLSFEPMAALGWNAVTVPWRSEPAWNAFDAVYICTPWDYPKHPAEFTRVLEDIDGSDAVLLNDLSIVRWNLDKSYLQDIAIARRVFAHIDPLPVYGRGDWVRGPDGRFLLMELELIEPSLYLRTDPGAAARFARAFDERFEELAGK